jgi:hypothetical protein
MLVRSKFFSPTNASFIKHIKCFDVIKMHGTTIKKKVLVRCSVLDRAKMKVLLHGETK